MSQEVTDIPNEHTNLKILTNVAADNISKQDLNIGSTELSSKTSETYNQVDYLKSDKPFVIARFIFECGHKLNTKVLTISTALQLMHRFNKTTQNTEYDHYLISAACLYLAGKVEDNDHIRLRDLINVVYTTLHQEREPLELTGEYYALRAAIVQAELLLLRMVQFQTKFIHPHKYLLHYLKSLKDWISPDVWNKYPVARTSWSLLQDSYHDSNVTFDTNPELLSVACIQLALQTYGIKVPFMSDTTVDEKAWYRVFCKNATKDKLWFIMKQLMDIYNQELVYISPIANKVTN